MKNTIIKVLSLVMAMVMIMGSVLVISASAADECKHENYEQYGDPVPATCTEWGFTLYQCSDCKKEYKAEYNTLEKPHNATQGFEWKVIEDVAATCIADAYKVSECSVCKTTVTLVEEGTKGDAHHNWSDWTTVKSTCTEAGNKTRTCSICNKVETEALTVNGHEWIALEDQVVEPKCSRYIDPKAPDNDKAAYGSMPYKCKNCDATRTVEIEPRNDHRFVQMDKNVSGLCGTVYLETAGKYCEWCYMSESGVPHEVIQHKLPAPAENACSLGVETVVCEICKVSVERKVEHEFGDEPTAYKPATCDKYGYELYGCIHCGNKFENVVLEPIGHKWEATGKTAAATCTTAGGIEYACANGCGKTKVDADPDAPAKGHSKNLVEVKAVEPTCTTVGYTAGKYCPDCDTYVEGHVEIKALGHANVTYICTVAKLKDIVCSRCGNADADKTGIAAIVIEGAVESHVWVRDDANSVDPTCTTSGTDVLTCKYCSMPGTKTVPALGHNTKTETILPTCTTAGYTIVTCQTCLATISNVVLEINPEGHIGEVTKYVAPTCTTDGVEIGACVNCGKLYEKVLPKLGHDIKTIEAKAATCTDAGNTAGSYCARTECGEVFLESKPIEALGHKEETVTGYAATCTTKGLTDGKKCKTCGVVTVAQKEIEAINHYYNGVQYSETKTVVANCKGDGQIGYIAHECVFCDAAYIDNYTDALVHAWETTWTKVDVTCETDGYEYRNCLNGCGATEVKKDSTVAATGHKNKAGETISTKCTRPEEFDNVCVNAHCNYSDKKVPSNHNYVKNGEVADPCVSYSYMLYICEDCGLKRVDTVVSDEPNHKWEVISQSAKQTAEKAQETVSKCKVCGETKTEYKASGITYKYEIINASNPGFNFVNGTKKLQIVIYIYSDKAEFHNVFANFTYDKNVLNFKSATVANTISDVTLDGVVHKVEDGKLNFTAYVDNNEDGELTNAVLTGTAQKFITLEFEVKAEAASGNTVVKMANVAFNDVNGKSVGSKTSTVEAMTATIKVFADANNDGKISSADFAALQKLILTDGYTAEADLDGNGKVEAKDLSLLQKLVVGSYTVAQLAGNRK